MATLSVERAMRSLNLLPWRDRMQRTRRRDAWTALLCGLVAGMAVVAATEFHFARKLREVERRAAQLQAAIAVHRGTAAEQRNLQARNADMGAVLTEMQRVRRHNRAVRAWLEELPEAVPPELRLTRLSIRGTVWELQGVAGNLEPAAQLLQTIRAMPTVSESRIEHLRSESGQAREFALTGVFAE